MNLADVPEIGYSSTEEFYRFLWSFDDEMIERIAIKGASYEDVECIIIDLVQNIRRAHVTLASETINLNESAMFNGKLLELFALYQENSNFSFQVKRFLNHRSRLNKNLYSNANELDRNSLITAAARLIGFSAGAINSLILGILLEENVIESWFKISPLLEHSVQCLLVGAAYFGPICIMLSFAEYFRFKYIVHCSINLIEEDRKFSMRLGKSLLTKDTMQRVVTDLFSETIGEEFIMSVESRSKYLTDTEKVFAAVLFSNMRKDPLYIKDVKFLCKTYLFSRTKAAKEWYSRMLSGIHLIDQKIDIRDLEEELLQLKMAYYTSSQPYGILTLFLESLNAPRLVLCGLYSTCLFCDIRKYKERKISTFSKDLRMRALHSRELPQRIGAYRKLKELRRLFP